MSKLLETLCLQTMFAPQTKNINNMKNLKSIFLATFLTIGAFSTTVFTSCEKDACDDIVCANGGTCTEGICACPSGYTGTLCDTKANSSFVGNWSAKEKVNGATTWGSPYTVTITADGTDPKAFYLVNYGNYGCTAGTYQVTAMSNNGKDYSISNTACSTNFTGSGSIATSGSTSTVSGTYTATYGTPVTTDNVVIEMTK